MAKIAALVTDLFEDSEYLSPKEALEEAGHEVVPISFETGTIHGKSENSAVEIEHTAKDTEPAEFDALLIPGGYSPDKLRSHECVLQFARHFAYQEKPIFTICHGPQLLVNAEVLQGKNITAVKNVAIDVKNAGANYFDEEVVTDRSGLISSRTPDDLPAFNRAIVKALEK